MIRDNNLVFSDAQNVLSTADSTQTVDTLAAGDAIRPGARIRVTSKVLAVDSGSNSTFKADLQTSADNITYTSLIATGALAFAVWSPAGAVILDAVIPNGALRYLKMVYTVASGPNTSSSIDAAILLDTEKLLDRGL